MTDATITPPPAWLTVLMGFAPSLNQSLIVIVTAVASIGGTIATQRITAPPAVSAQKQIADAVNRLDGRLTEILGVCGAGVDEIQSLRTDFKTPRVYKKPAAPAK